MAINDKLNRIKEIKEDIKQALIDKGVEVTDEDSFGSYADKITNIPQEGGGDPYYEDLYNMRTSNGTNMAYLFKGMTGDNLDASTIDISKCTSLAYFLNGCNVKNINVDGIVTDKIKDISYIFQEASNFESIDVSSWDTSNVTNMYGLFYSARSIKEVDLSSWNTAKVYNMASIFGFANKLTTANISNWNFKANTTKPNSIFGYTYITDLTMDNCDFSESTTDYSTFTGSLKQYAKLKTLSAKNVKFGATCKKFFKDTTDMHTIDVSGCDVTLLTDMSELFSGCTSITELDLSTWNTKYVTSYANMFANVPASAVITVNDGLWNPDMTEEATGFAGTFVHVGVEPVSEYYTDYTIDNEVMAFAMRSVNDNSIENGPYLPQLSNGYDYVKLTLNDGITLTDLSTDASLVSSIRVYYPEETTSIKFANTKVKEVTHLNGSNITDCTGMFTNCVYLESADLTSLDSTKVTVDTTMFEGVSPECSLSFNESWDIPNEDMGKEEPVIPTSVNVTVHYYNPNEEYGCGEWISFTKVDDASYSTGSDFGLEDDFGRYTQLELDYNLPYNVSASFQGVSFAEGQFTFTKDKELWTIYGDSTIYEQRPEIPSDEPENPYRVEYTLYVKDGCTDALNINKKKYLPQITDDVGGPKDYSELITIHLKDGTTTNDMGTLVTDIDRVVIEYPEGTGAVKFNDTSSYVYIKEILYINVDNIVDMSFMFSGCRNLEKINGIENWDTSGITNMSWMFNYCRALTPLDLSKWDVSKVTDMQSMFYHCNALTTLNISNWNTESLTTMKNMFSWSYVENIIGIENINVSKVTTMENTFSYASKLTTLDLSNWDISSVTNMIQMFASCGYLQSLNLTNWNTSNVTNAFNMFYSTPYSENLANCVITVSDSLWTLTETDTKFAGTFTRI